MGYFKDIDTEEKAYYLGLIYADGCLIAPSTYGGKKRTYRLSIMLQKEDDYVLNNLANHLNAKLYVKHSPSQIKKKEKPNIVINKSGEELGLDLISQGVYPNKTIVGLKFPKIPKDLENHFIRGFFDGDGSIVVDNPKSSYVSKKTGTSKRKKVRGRIFFIGTSNEFLLSILKRLPIEKYSHRSVIKRMETHTYVIERQGDVIKTFYYLYNNSSIFLKRKKDKFDKLISSQAKDTSLEGSETT